MPSNGARVTFEQDNPKREGSQTHARYEIYKSATSVGDAKGKGMSVADWKDAVKNNNVKVGLADDESAKTRGGGDDSQRLKDRSASFKAVDGQEEARKKRAQEAHDRAEADRFKKLESLRFRLSPNKPMPFGSGARVV